MNDYSVKVETRRGERIEVSVTNIPANFPVTQKISMHCFTEEEFLHREQFASTRWAAPWQVRGALGRNAVCLFEPPRGGPWYIRVHFGYTNLEGWEPNIQVRVMPKEP